jgi:sulfatase maturation enzyme AslB (radical SAM superfamily)
MGTSTDAILFYGFHADEGEWDDFFGEEWENTFAAKVGTPEPVVGFDTEKHKAEHVAFWRARKKLVEAEPCEVDSHCSGECPMPYVCVKASKTKACRGYPQEIKSLTVEPEWEIQLNKFCELMNIPWQEPRWWLVSDWT